MFTLPGLPYDYDALEPYIDEATMRIHHDLHHGVYVDNLNKALDGYDKLSKMTVEELLENLDKIPQKIREKVRNQGGGHFNHSLFWRVMSPNPNGEMRTAEGSVKTEIEKDFGDFANFKEQFTNTAMSRFGSGWAWLVFRDSKLAVVDSSNQDSPLSVGTVPILCIDVWEHAYYLKYQNRRSEYIKNWWNVVNWEEINRRYEICRSSTAA